MALNARQKAFVAAYAGNATQAARDAGYTGSDATLGVTGHELLKNPKIAEAIKARETKRDSKRIATREERQAFWTEVFHDSEQNILARLKASELLGKSEADFIERQRHEGSITINVANPYPADDE